MHFKYKRFGQSPSKTASHWLQTFKNMSLLPVSKKYNKLVVDKSPEKPQKPEDSKQSDIMTNPTCNSTESDMIITWEKAPTSGYNPQNTIVYNYVNTNVEHNPFNQIRPDIQLKRIVNIINEETVSETVQITRKLNETETFDLFTCPKCKNYKLYRNGSTIALNKHEIYNLFHDPGRNMELQQIIKKQIFEL